MGAKITVQQMEEYNSNGLSQMKASVVNDLKPEVRAIYDIRMRLQGITAEEMQSLTNLEPFLLQQKFLGDLRP